MTPKDDLGFLSWWYRPEQDRLRKYCAPNWAFIVWCASRDAIEVEIPPSVTTAEIGPAISREKMVARLTVNGIKVKS